jgi:hypothetical protein
MNIKEAIDFFLWLKENRSRLLETGLDDKIYINDEVTTLNSWNINNNIFKNTFVKKLTEEEFKEKLFDLFKEYFKDELSLEAL